MHQVANIDLLSLVEDLCQKDLHGNEKRIKQLSNQLVSQDVTTTLLVNTPTD